MVQFDGATEIYSTVRTIYDDTKKISKDSSSFLKKLNEEISNYEKKVNFELQQSGLILMAHKKAYDLLEIIHRDVDNVHKDLNKEVNYAYHIAKLLKDARANNRTRVREALTQIYLHAPLHKKNLDDLKSDIDKINSDINKFINSVDDKKLNLSQKKQLNNFFINNTHDLVNKATEILDSLTKNNTLVTDEVDKINDALKANGTIGSPLNP